jgi:hypothetical protein
MMFVASILISNDFMRIVEASRATSFGKSYPVSPGDRRHVSPSWPRVLAMRKFPANYRQYRTFLGHRSLMAHTDATPAVGAGRDRVLLFFSAGAPLSDVPMHPAHGPGVGLIECGAAIGGRSPRQVFCGEPHGGIGSSAGGEMGLVGGESEQTRRLAAFSGASPAFGGVGPRIRGLA